MRTRSYLATAPADSDDLVTTTLLFRHCRCISLFVSSNAAQSVRRSHALAGRRPTFSSPKTAMSPHELSAHACWAIPNIKPSPFACWPHEVSNGYTLSHLGPACLPLCHLPW